VITPQVPTRRAVGQTIFNHHTHGHIDDPVGVMSAGGGSITQINVEMLATWATVVRRVCHQEINRMTGVQIAEVMQRALSGCVARGELTTARAGSVLVVTMIKSQLRFWEVLDIDNPLGGVWHVFTRSVHDGLP